MRIALLCIGLLLAASTEAATVLIVSTPSGATVTVGEKEEGKTPLRLQLDGGNYTLTVTKKGYAPTIQFVSVENKLMRVNITLEKQKQPVDVVFEDATHDGWYVFVDNALLVEEHMPVFAPATAMLAMGKHRIVLMKDGYRDVILRVEVVEGGQLIEVKARKGISSVRRFPWLKFIGAWRKTDTGTMLYLKSDFTFELCGFDKHAKHVTGPFKLNGNDITFTYVSDPAALTLDGNTLTGWAGRDGWTFIRAARKEL